VKQLADYGIAEMPAELARLRDDELLATKLRGSSVTLVGSVQRAGAWPHSIIPNEVFSTDNGSGGIGLVLRQEVVVCKHKSRSRVRNLATADPGSP
jgi:hypothetical protein